MSKHNSSNNLNAKLISRVTKYSFALVVMLGLLITQSNSPAAAIPLQTRKCTSVEWSKIVSQKSWMESSKSHYEDAINQLNTANKNLSRKGLTYKEMQSWISKQAKAQLEVSKQKWQMDADAAYYKKLSSKCTRF